MSTSDTERNNRFVRIEPLLLFLVLYLPAYLSQSDHLSGRIFNSVLFNLSYLVTVLPRMALIVYLIALRSMQRESDPSPEAGLARYGLKRLRPTDFAWAIVALCAIELLILPLSALAGLLARDGVLSVTNPVHWRLTNPLIVPLVFLTTMTAGYSEELFFRSYLLTALPSGGVRVGVAVAAASLLFALGHLYEGALGFAGTLLIGVVLSLFFLRRRSIHVVAIAHGLYNFITLLATLSSVGVRP